VIISERKITEKKRRGRKGGREKKRKMEKRERDVHIFTIPTALVASEGS